MSLTTDLATLQGWIAHFPKVGVEFMKRGGGAIYTLDFVMIGALKRTHSLACGINEMVAAKNMTCARAMLRMQLDTVTRLLAYTYVEDASLVAEEVLGGRKLSEFRSREGDSLRDSYLVRKFSEDHPWAEKVYDSTSGYVHFSERQFFDSIKSLGRDGEGHFELSIGPQDNVFPESSWEEVVACFNKLTVVLVDALDSYYAQKGA